MLSPFHINFGMTIDGENRSRNAGQCQNNKCAHENILSLK